MANDITNPRLLILDTLGVVYAVSVPVVITKILYIPSTIDHDVILQEYSNTGVARTAIVIKAYHTGIDPVETDFGSGIRLNGLVVGTVDGGTVYVYTA
jgi:hypothetical protein